MVIRLRPRRPRRVWFLKVALWLPLTMAASALAAIVAAW